MCDEFVKQSKWMRTCRESPLDSGALTIFRRAHVGYEVIDIISVIFNKREWNNCFIKNHHKILLDLADFALQEQPEDNLMVVISWAWYNGSYTMATKPIKTLGLHYTMIQFSINTYWCCITACWCTKQNKICSKSLHKNGSKLTPREE